MCVQDPVRAMGVNVKYLLGGLLRREAVVVPGCHC